MFLNVWVGSVLGPRPLLLRGGDIDPHGQGEGRLAGIRTSNGAVWGKIKTEPPQPRASPAAAKPQSSHKVQQESSSYEEGQPHKEDYVADWGKHS